MKWNVVSLNFIWLVLFVRKVLSVWFVYMVFGCVLTYHQSILFCLCSILLRLNDSQPIKVTNQNTCIIDQPEHLPLTSLVWRARKEWSVTCWLWKWDLSTGLVYCYHILVPLHNAQEIINQSEALPGDPSHVDTWLHEYDHWSMEREELSLRVPQLCHR